MLKKTMITLPAFSDTDNETKVRESLVAPLLRDLGYAEEEILPEVPMKVRVQDEIKQVRADYVISAEHNFGLPMNRLVVEVKRPAVPVEGYEVLEQARLYASHYSVQASHVVLVNGVDLCVYEPSGPMLNLVQKFKVEQLNVSWMKLNDLIGAESFRSQFAGMQILELIGSGGYGQVFRAKNLKLGRIEALKILHPSAETADSVRRRFERGARGLAALEHPYICRVFDLDVYRGRPYYRMELISGVSLTEFLRRKNLDFADRLILFQKICEALSHAHKVGVVHCDLKPENVLITDNAIPKLIDFDFCHLGTGASTILSQIVATIAYMDPTIWKDPQNRDERADIYSAGLLLWSALTGEELRPGWTPHSLMDELSRAGTDAEKLGPLILRCLQENRNERPQSIEEFVSLFGIKDPRVSIQGLIDGSVSNFTVHSPAREFEYRFRLWQQTKDLPGGVDFDRITRGIPQRPMTAAEREFIFRATCIHWSRKYRTLFKTWDADDMISSARAVLEDRSLNAAHEGRTGESHPGRRPFQRKSLNSSSIGCIEKNENPSSERRSVI